MNKNNELKKDIFAIFIYILTFSVIYLILTTDNHLFASNVDFRTQHYLIPEYFRTLFYSTGNLFPDFAFNIGAGVNIYNLSYYGLFRPDVLIGCLIPSVAMKDIIIIYMVINLIFTPIVITLIQKKVANTLMDLRAD